MPTLTFKTTVKDYGKREPWERNGKSGTNCTIITDNGEQYNSTLVAQFNQSQFAEFEKIPKGSEIELSVNIESSPYTTKDGESKHFHNIRVWKVKVIEGSSKPAPQPQATLPKEPEPWKEQENDLPF